MSSLNKDSTDSESSEVLSSSVRLSSSRPFDDISGAEIGRLYKLKSDVRELDGSNHLSFSPFKMQELRAYILILQSDNIYTDR